jgi:hypothetical protein
MSAAWREDLHFAASGTVTEFTFRATRRSGVDFKLQLILLRIDPLNHWSLDMNQ